MLKDIVTLVDMDNTIADYNEQFEKRIAEVLPPEAFTNRDHTLYWIEDSFEEIYHDAIHNIICEPGFFLNMRPIDGALQAIAEMVENGMRVQICTTPHNKSKVCIEEKQQWVRKHLGESFVTEMVFADDKTIVPGHILIDDRADLIKTDSEPLWKQIVFDAKYNQHMDTPHRLKHWKDWRSAVEGILKSSA